MRSLHRHITLIIFQLLFSFYGFARQEPKNLLFCFGTEKVSFTSAIPVKVMTYNIRFDHEGDNLDNWHHRKSDLADYILSQNPDFLGVQEALYHQMTFLQEALENYQYIGAGRDDGKTGGEFSAIFYRTDKWTVLIDSTFWLSESPAIPSKGWDAALPRICTYGVFKNRNEQTIAVFNTHFDHVGQTARENSVKLLESYILPLDETNPVILMGDFNVEPPNPAYQAVIDFMNDSRSIAKELLETSEGTFNSFKISGTFDSRIDYIFVNSKAVLVKKYTVEAPLTKAGRQASDHFPVIVDLEIQ